MSDHTFSSGDITVTVMPRRECVRAYGRRRKGTARPASIVSITSIGNNVPAFDEAVAPMSLRLKFDDVLGDDERCMSERQAEDVVSFVRRSVDGGLRDIVVHCDGGVSRSAGVASAIIDVFGDKGHDGGLCVWEDANLFPNEWCYKLVREAGGLETSDRLVRERIQANIDAYRRAEESL